MESLSVQLTLVDVWILQLVILILQLTTMMDLVLL